MSSRNQTKAANYHFKQAKHRHKPCHVTKTSPKVLPSNERPEIQDKIQDFLNKGLDLGCTLETIILTVLIQGRAYVELSKVYEDYVVGLYPHLKFNPLLQLLQLVRHWSSALQKDKNTEFCHKYQIYEKKLKILEKSVVEVWNNVRQTRSVDKLSFKSNNVQVDAKLLQTLFSVWKHELFVYRGHPSLGYQNSKGQILKLDLPHPLLILKLETSLASSPYQCGIDGITLDKWEQEGYKSVHGLKQVLEKVKWSTIQVSDIGLGVIRKFCDVWGRGVNNVSASLQEKLTTLCSKNIPILETNEANNSISVFVPPIYKEMASILVQQVVNHVKESLLDETLTLNESQDTGLLEVTLHKGGVAKEVSLKQDDFPTTMFVFSRNENIRDYAYANWESFQNHMTDISGIDASTIKAIDVNFLEKELVQKKKRYSLWLKVTFANRDDAVKAYLQNARHGHQEFLFVPAQIHNSMPSHLYQTDYRVQAELQWVMNSSRAHVTTKGHGEVLKAFETKFVTVSGVKAKIKLDLNNHNAFYVCGLRADMEADAIREIYQKQKIRVSNVTIQHGRISQEQRKIQYQKHTDLIEDTLKQLSPNSKFQLIPEKGVGSHFAALLNFASLENYFELSDKLHKLQVCGSDIQVRVGSTGKIVLNTRIFDSYKDCIPSKIKVINEKYTRRVSVQFQRKSHTTVVSVHAINAPLAKAVLEELVNYIHPESVKLTAEELALLLTKQGEDTLKDIMQNTQTVMDIYDDKMVFIFGTKKQKADAKQKLEERMKILKEGRVIKFIYSYSDLEYNSLVAKVESLDLVSGQYAKVLAASSDELVVQLPKRGCSLGSVRSQLADHLDCDLTYPECGLCFCDIERECYTTQLCGHTFCRECIDSHVKTICEASSFPIPCPHDGCCHPLVVADIKMLFPTHCKMAPLIKSAVSLFVTRSAGRYRHCVSMDCPGVYEVTTVGQRIVCAYCEKSMCSSCQVRYHDDKTCMEFKPRLEEIGKLEEHMQHWVSEDPANRKLCPSCHMGIEKNGGCDHVHCIYCHKSICWVCLAVFEGSGACYDHIDAEHPDYDDYY